MRDLGIGIHPSAEVLPLPGIASYVGSDIVAGGLATSLGQSEAPELLVDMGTNGEIVLAMNGRLISCSTAAGPAFEGASIRQGMNALVGAIEDVAIKDSRVDCSIIGGGKEKGICGTGLIGAIDELRVAGGIDETRRFADSGGMLCRRVFGEGRDRAFRLTDESTEIALYQQDVREFQLGKAAVRAGIESLLDRIGVNPEDLGRLYIAGAFGTHLRPHRAIRTGLLPGIPVDRIHAIGNSAGQGAVFTLLDHRLRSEAEYLSQRVEYIELSTQADFSDRYLDDMSFPVID